MNQQTLQKLVIIELKKVKTNKLKPEAFRINQFVKGFLVSLEIFNCEMCLYLESPVHFITVHT